MSLSRGDLRFLGRVLLLLVLGVLWAVLLVLAFSVLGCCGAHPSFAGGMPGASFPFDHIPPRHDGGAGLVTRVETGACGWARSDAGADGWVVVVRCAGGP